MMVARSSRTKAFCAVAESAFESCICPCKCVGMTWPFAARIVGLDSVYVHLDSTDWSAAATKHPVAPESRIPNLIGGDGRTTSLTVKVEFEFDLIS